MPKLRIIHFHSRGRLEKVMDVSFIYGCTGRMIVIVEDSAIPTILPLEIQYKNMRMTNKY